MIDTRIARVAKKLKHVQETWQGLPESFGAEVHEFRMNPPLSEQDLLAFEAEHGILLPEDYRAFLQCIGNGGAGPFYGILPLASAVQAAGEECDGYLRSPSPLTDDLVRTYEWDWILLHSVIPPVTIYSATSHDWRLIPPQGIVSPYQGTLTICDQGCSYAALLIVSGSARGCVVYVDYDNQPPYFPENTDFLSWYERWLDELLARYDTFWFGARMPGNEDDLLQALNAPHTQAQRRAQALEALTYLPSLSADAVNCVEPCLRDASPMVRASAARVAAKHVLATCRDSVHTLLKDADPSVRSAAVEALAALPPVDWSALRPLLLDPHREVALQVLRTMGEAHSLTVDDLRPALASQDRTLRLAAIHALGRLTGMEAEQLVLSQLAEPDLDIRRVAIESLADLRSGVAVPALIALLHPGMERLILINVIGALRRIGDVRAVPALIAATCYANPWARYDAAQALGELGDRQAISALQALLDDTLRPEERDANGGLRATTTYRICDQARMALEKLRQ